MKTSKRQERRAHLEKIKKQAYKLALQREGFGKRKYLSDEDVAQVYTTYIAILKNDMGSPQCTRKSCWCKDYRREPKRAWIVEKEKTYYDLYCE